ncbi:hypothetical protein MHYP_G00043590 [Metynnis hypsauchen]
MGTLPGQPHYFSQIPTVSRSLSAFKCVAGVNLWFHTILEPPRPLPCLSMELSVGLGHDGASVLAIDQPLSDQT